MGPPVHPAFVAKQQIYCSRNRDRGLRKTVDSLNVPCSVVNIFMNYLESWITLTFPLPLFIALYISKGPETVFKVLHSLYYIANMLVLIGVFLIDSCQFSPNKLMVCHLSIHKLYLMCMLHEGKD